MNLAFCVCVESPRGGCLCVIIFQYSHTYFCVQIPDLSLFSAVAIVISIVIALSLSLLLPLDFPHFMFYSYRVPFPSLSLSPSLMLRSPKNVCINVVRIHRAQKARGWRAID